MQMKKRMLSLILAGVLVVSNCIPAMAAPDGNAAETDNVSAESKTVEAVEVEGVSRLNQEENQAKLREPMDIASYSDSEVVTVIVEMGEAPVLDYFGTSTYAVSDGETTAGEAVAEFLASDEAQEFSEELLDGQDAVISEISSLGSTEMAQTTGEVEVVAQWTRSANAMAVRVPYGILDDIQELDGVRRAYVQHVYDYPEPQTGDLDQPLYNYSLDMIGTEKAWADGYTGKGMLVAVLDTGVDIIQDKTNGAYIGSHEVFSNDSGV